MEQQQKERIPYIYVREIPNKPPPPYTPPLSQNVPLPRTVLPSNPSQVDLIVDNLVEVLYEANERNELNSVQLTEELASIDNNLSKTCYELLFDLTKEFTSEHYDQFKAIDCPSWLKLNKYQDTLLSRRKFDKNDLSNYLKKNIKQIFGMEKTDTKQKALTKWCHKKRDHVDELLIIESQLEEIQWINYDYDELIVKNDLTNDIMNLLIGESATVVQSILRKKKHIDKC